MKLTKTKPQITTTIVQEEDDLNPGQQMVNNREQIVKAMIAELQKCESVLKLGFNLPETTIARLTEIKN